MLSFLKMIHSKYLASYVYSCKLSSVVHSSVKQVIGGSLLALTTTSTGSVSELLPFGNAVCFLCMRSFNFTHQIVVQGDSLFVSVPFALLDYEVRAQEENALRLLFSRVLRRELNAKNMTESIYWPCHD